ncbi:unnamed protein product [Brassica rapa subsp. trilocularis]
MEGKDSRLNVTCPVTCPCQRNAANDADHCISSSFSKQRRHTD